MCIVSATAVAPPSAVVRYPGNVNVFEVSGAVNVTLPPLAVTSQPVPVPWLKPRVNVVPLTPLPVVLTTARKTARLTAGMDTVSELNVTVSTPTGKTFVPNATPSFSSTAPFSFKSL